MGFLWTHIWCPIRWKIKSIYFKEFCILRLFEQRQKLWSCIFELAIHSLEAKGKAFEVPYHSFRGFLIYQHGEEVFSPPSHQTHIRNSFGNSGKPTVCMNSLYFDLRTFMLTIGCKSPHIFNCNISFQKQTFANSPQFLTNALWTLYRTIFTTVSMSTTSQPAVKGSFILREPVFLESDKEQSLHNQRRESLCKIDGIVNRSWTRWLVSRMKLVSSVACY